ncbi:MAG: 4Fe-4S cluster-binding domain-containing protein [Candidatus Aenigmatarchaeota archaeon]
MIFQYIDLKKQPYQIVSINDELIQNKPQGYQPNRNIIIISQQHDVIFLFSFRDAYLIQVSKKDFNQYYINFAKQKFIPRPFLNYKLITPINAKQSNNNYGINVDLVLTQKCNLRCSYCYAQANRLPDSRSMSFEIAKAMIDFIARYKKQHPVFLKFIGAGENTLEFKLLKKIFNYAKKTIQNITINPISTNGVISLKVADWLIQNVSQVQISCDGPAFIQNKYRPLRSGKGSSFFVERTIKYFIKHKKDFVVRATMTDDFYKYDTIILNYFWQLGVKNIFFGPLSLVGEAKKYLLRNQKITKNNYLMHLGTSLLKLYQEYFKLTELLNELLLPITISRFNNLGSTMNCGIYYKSIFTIDPFGFISACERHTGPQQLQEYSFMKDFIIGRYDFNTKSIKINFHKYNKLVKILKYQMEINNCTKCSVFQACSHICLYTIGLDLGNINSNVPYCNESQFINIVPQYLTQRYFVNKKPCFEYQNSKLMFSLLYHSFEVKISYDDKPLQVNPYIIITDIKKLSNIKDNIIKYKNNHKDLILFLLRFELPSSQRNMRNGKVIINFLYFLKANHVYFKITTPLSRLFFGVRYEYICRLFNIPINEKYSLELYRVKNNKVYFYNHIIGTKKFSDYLNREEIYRDFLNLTFKAKGQR